MKRSPLAKKTMKFAFLGIAAIVGVLLAANAVRQKGTIIKSKSKKLIGGAKRAIMANKDKLNERQKAILDIFAKYDKVTNDMVKAIIPNVTERTLRRDLNFLEEKKYIRQIGKTKGSYYILVN